VKGNFGLEDKITAIRDHALPSVTVQNMNIGMITILQPDSESHTEITKFILVKQMKTGCEDFQWTIFVSECPQGRSSDNTSDDRNFSK
jgi:hypothetical protein